MPSIKRITKELTSIANDLLQLQEELNEIRERRKDEEIEKKKNRNYKEKE